MNKASELAAFKLQVSGGSLASASTAPTMKELMSRQCTEIDIMAQQVLDEEAVKDAIASACAECAFCVSVADPRLPDKPLIAVSEGFEVMTGFRRCEILGVNCRFLNSGCNLDPAVLADLRHASETGAPFTALLTNRRKNGQFFLNLLDLRGLTVARTSSGEDLWFLVGIQADVSHLADDEIENLEDNLPALKEVAGIIRQRITESLTGLSVVGEHAHFHMASSSDSPRSLLPLQEPAWREGPQLGMTPARYLAISRSGTLQEFPELDMRRRPSKACSSKRTPRSLKMQEQENSQVETDSESETSSASSASGLSFRQCWSSVKEDMEAYRIPFSSKLVSRHFPGGVVLFFSVFSTAALLPEIQWFAAAVM
jgi:hypothetical protein